MVVKPSLKIVIRGHVRDSFSTDLLYDFLRRLTDIYDTKFYIHTWKVKQTSVSWRPIEDDTTAITMGSVESYFRELAANIRVLIIEDDSDAQLCGSTEGKLASTRTPKLGWKRYIYGQFRILRHLRMISNDDTEFLLNTRFDLFSNSYVFPIDEIVQFVARTRGGKIDKNVFMREGVYCGVDNIIAGTIRSNYELMKKIHEDLDDIVAETPDIRNPEFFVPIANGLL